MKSRFLIASLFLWFSVASGLSGQLSTLCIQSVITVVSGNTTVSCDGDGTLEVIKFSTTRVPTPHVYVVTDPNGNIVKVSTNNTINFAGLNQGILRVYAVSYLGQQLAQVGGNIFTDQLGSICYALSSNYIEITNLLPEAGDIALAPDGSKEAVLCLEPADPQPLQFTATGQTGNFIYLITDADGNIIDQTANPSFNFTGFDIGAYRVYGLAYFGNLMAAPGQNIFTSDLSDGCFNTTGSFIEVEILYPDGGQLRFTGSQEETVVICDSPNDNAEPLITYNTENSVPVNFAYFLTDAAGTILGMLDGAPLNVNTQLPYGESRIWGLSYMGDLLLEAGDNVTDFPPSTDCADFSDNYLTIIRTLVDGGAVQFQGGGNTAVVCGGDDDPDLLSFMHQTTAAGASYGFVVTNLDGRILVVIPNGDALDFNLAQAGICRVWGLSYTGEIIAQTGDDVFTTAISDGCYELSFNFLEVRKEAVEGGTVSTESGASLVYSCPGDGTPDIIHFDSTGNTTGAYLYLVTDANNHILTVTDQDLFDFEGLPAGAAHVWGLAFTGVFTGSVGQNITNAVLSSECFDLSDNPITVVRQQPDGGSISSATGADTYHICPDDGIADIIGFAGNTAYEGPYTYLITDDQNVILTSTDAELFDFDQIPAGVCRIWGLAYTGNLLFQAGQNAGEVLLSDDCYDLSDNFITVFRQQPDGGLVALEDGSTTAYICPGDGLEDLIPFANSTVFSGPYAFLVTDENNIVAGIAAGAAFDFETIPTGTYRVWGVAYTGNLTVLTGQDAAATALSDDCYDLSDNFISVVRVTPEGGQIVSPEGDSISLCVGDHIPDVVHFASSGASNSPYAFLVTDENGFLISPLLQDSFDFDNAVGGGIRIYGLAYTGALSFLPGDPVEEVVAANPECLDLSDNYLVLNLTRVDGSLIFTETGEKEVVYVCAVDGNDDIISFFSGTLATAGAYNFIITSETNTILGFINGNQQNFENTGLKRLRVWGVSYTGGFEAGIGDNIVESTLSSECYALSNNFITIVRDLPDGGKISTIAGDTSLLLCIGAVDGQLPMVTTSVSQSGYVYLVTNTANQVLEVVGSDVIDFNAFEPGDYRIWGLSYTGELNAAPGIVIEESSVLASSCFELSENFVEVTRSAPVGGGVLSGQDGQTTFYFCPDANLEEAIVILSSDSQVEGDSYTYVIANETNQIIIPGILGNIIDFEPAADGIYRIYGISYNGTFLAGFGDNVLTDPLSDTCYDPSDNFIEVIKFSPNVDTIKTDLLETEVVFIAGDGEPDVFTFVAQGITPTPFAFVVTDENNTTLEILDGDFKDFENGGPGIFKVWCVSYTGNLTLEIGEDVTFKALSDECFDLSDNFVSVFGLESAAKSTVEEIRVKSARPAFSGRAAANELQIAPNPSSISAMISWEWPLEYGKGTMRLVDLSGRIVNSWEVEMTKGSNLFMMDTSGLPSGSFVLRMETPEGIYMNRIIIAR